MSVATLLTPSPIALRVLGRSPVLSRAVGGAASRSTAFHEADELDREATSITTWRGLDNRTLFGPVPLSGRLNSWGDLNGKGVYAPRPIEDFRGVRTGSYPIPYGIELKINDPDVEAVQETARRNPEDRIALGDPVFNKIYHEGENPRLGDLVAGDRALREAYTEHAFTGAERQASLEDDYADYATGAGTEEADWVDEGELARLVLENRGGIADRLAEDEELRELVESDPTDVLLGDLRGEARERVLGELRDETKRVLDEDFFEDHPLAALDLLLNPATLAEVNDSISEAERYRGDADTTERRIEEELGERANARVSNRPYSDVSFADELPEDPATWYADGEDPFELVTWLDENRNAAEAVVTEGALNRTDGFTDYLNQPTGLEAEEAFPPDVVAAYWAREGREATGGELPAHLFENSSALSMMAARDGTLAAGLEEDAEAIRSAFPNPAEAPRNTLDALRGYGFGLADRSLGTFARIA